MPEQSSPPATTGFVRHDGWAIALLALLPFLFYHQVVFQQTHTLMGWWDASIQSFAWYAHIADALREASFPYWDMHTEAGEYFIGEMQTGAFYPPNWLLAAVFDPTDLTASQYRADLFLVLHLLVSSTFAYLLLRKLGLTPFAALAGAVLASYFGALAQRVTAQPNIFIGMTWLPAVLYCVLQACHAKGRRGQLIHAGLGGMALGFCILSGHLYSYIHIAFLSALLLFFTCLAGLLPWRKAGLILAGLGICSVLIAYPQLDASVEYFKRAYKWYGEGHTAYPHVVPFAEFSRWAFSSWETVLTWRCGAGCTEVRTLFMGWTAWPLAVIGIACSAFARKVILPVLAVVILIAMAGDNPIGHLLYHVPVLNEVRIPSRILFVVPLLVGALAALGIDQLLRRKWPPAASIVTVCAIVAGIAVDLVHQHGNIAVTGGRKSDLPYNPATFYGDPVADWLAKSLGENSLYRWSVERKETLPPNLGQVNGINGLRGHRSSMHVNYFHHQVVTPDSGEWVRRLGLKYFVSETDYPHMDRVFSSGGKHVYEVPDPLPLVHAMRGGDYSPLPIDEVQWRTNSLRLRLDTGYEPVQGERIFFGLTRFPGWQLHVDGEERELRHGSPGDGAFLSAALLRGDREMILRFRPRRVLAYWLVPISFLLTLGVLICRQRCQP